MPSGAGQPSGTVASSSANAAPGTSPSSRNACDKIAALGSSAGTWTDALVGAPVVQKHPCVDTGTGSPAGVC